MSETTPTLSASEGRCGAWIYAPDWHYDPDDWQAQQFFSEWRQCSRRGRFAYLNGRPRPEPTRGIPLCSQHLKDVVFSDAPGRQAPTPVADAWFEEWDARRLIWEQALQTARAQHQPPR